MSFTEHMSQEPVQTVLPHISNRTLHHPSMSLYMQAGFTRPFPHREGSPTVHPIIPSEVFYSDPTMGCLRTPNILTGVRVYDCSKLNTPRPIMSTCLTPPNRPDPFRCGSHPTSDLGSLTWRTCTTYPQVHPMCILQLTEEEDQAVTNLLKLHYQDDISAVDLDNNLKDFHSVEEANEQICVGDQYLRELQQGRGWSERELEVAKTLSGFNQEENDLIRHLSGRMRGGLWSEEIGCPYQS